MTADRSLADPSADDALFSAAYDELKRIAHRQLRVRAANASLNTTELVHEAFLKLTPGNLPNWKDRDHFLGTASRAMRQVLVDIARRRSAAKRGGGSQAVTLGDAHARIDVALDDMLALDAALQRLDTIAPRLREVVELRFFGGIAEPEIARMLGVSARTVERDWLKARVFLLHELDARGR